MTYNFFRVCHLSHGAMLACAEAFNIFFEVCKQVSAMLGF